jgi:CheY-like chemotaxis protein
MPKENVSVALKSITRTYDVVVVEDNDDDVGLFLRALRKVQSDLEAEIDVHAVTSGAEAVQKLMERRVDAVFADVNVPAPDGVELTRQIRNSQLNRTTPVVIITGAEDRGVMARAFEAGANMFLFKPVDRMKLQRLIQVLLLPMERERRKVQRVKARCKVSIELGQKRLTGETADLSLGGMLVHVGQVVPVGSVVDVMLALPQTAAPVRACARVARIVDAGLMGLQFGRIGNAERDKLSRFLAPLLATA